MDGINYCAMYCVLNITVRYLTKTSYVVIYLQLDSKPAIMWRTLDMHVYIVNYL